MDYVAGFSAFLGWIVLPGFLIAFWALAIQYVVCWSALLVLQLFNLSTLYCLTRLWAWLYAASVLACWPLSLILSFGAFIQLGGEWYSLLYDEPVDAELAAWFLIFSLSPPIAVATWLTVGLWHVVKLVWVGLDYIVAGRKPNIWLQPAE